MADALERDNLKPWDPLLRPLERGRGVRRVEGGRDEEGGNVRGRRGHFWRSIVRQ